MYETNIDKQKKRNILNARVLDNLLLQDGYVTLPLLNIQEVTQLLNTYHKNHKKTPEGLYASAHVNDTNFRKKMNDAISDVVSDVVNQHFNNCRPLGGSFIVKTPGQAGYLFPHQDWNIVDESQHRSFNVWIPLVDTYPENGGIYVMPKSHLVVNPTFRGANLPPVFGDLTDVLWQQMTPLYLKAGEALIYDHRLIHASPVNKTNDLRIAVVFGIIPQEASLRYYYKNKQTNKVDEYEATVDFYYKENPQEGPTGLQLLNSKTYTYPNINEQQFNDFYNIKPATGKRSKQAISNSNKNGIFFWLFFSALIVCLGFISLLLRKR